MSLDLTILEYLHDAVLHWVRLDLDPESRTLAFLTTVDVDCFALDDSDDMRPPIAGKTIQVTASDLTLVRCCAHCAIVGDETIDRCDLSISSESREIISAGVRAGMGEPRGELSLVTHSGSEWDVAYESLRIDLA